MNLESEIYKKLLADTGVTGYVTKKGATPCISKGAVEPTTWGIADTTCSVYRVSSQNCGDEFQQVQHTVNCRGATQVIADALAGYVCAALNRKSSSGGAFFICSIEPVIPPADSTDNYNVPVTVIGKGSN